MHGAPDASSKVLPSFTFLREVEERSGQPVSRCYQCTKCTGGCPMNFAMDIQPSQIVRFIQLGLKEPLLKSRSIWICACCKTCKSRCPNGIDIGRLNDTLKEMAVEMEVPAAEKNVPIFHQVFLGSVEKNGRVHELGMMLGYKMKTGTYMQDAPLGLAMFRKGILKVMPEGIHQKREIQRIFQKAKENGR
ncbi:hypothetical protein SY88_20155 [Clostridiales bacterium PH28_bin88]|nr:hypothetical protein SY88_20155 [Clostridiales bacterium PH28_bin88]